MECDYQKIINLVLKPLLNERSTVVLFDFPNYSNVGDSAIWLGEEFYLKHVAKSNVIAVDDINLVGRPLPELPPDTIILIQGGGNFGDLYPRHQELREKLVSYYRNHRIIQLPQSIHFQDQEKRSQTSSILNSHNDFHLLVRDHNSLRQAQALHNGGSYLCPDMALCLGARKRPVEQPHDIVCLLRTDKEKVTADFSGIANSLSVYVADWIEEPDTMMKQLVGKLDRLHAKYPRWAKSLFRLKRPLYHLLAKERMRRGEAILSSGKVVVTDRLHGHILCTLLDIPHVVLDNSYRKIGNFRDAWRTGGDKCLSAETIEEAMQKAKELLAL